MVLQATYWKKEAGEEPVKQVVLKNDPWPQPIADAKRIHCWSRLVVFLALQKPRWIGYGASLPDLYIVWVNQTLDLNTLSVATAAITIIHQSRLHLGSLIGCFDSVCCVCEEISDVCVVFMFWLGPRTQCSGYAVNRRSLDHECAFYWVCSLSFARSWIHIIRIKT